MTLCVGTYVNDKHRGKLYNETSEQYYHERIECTNQVFKGSDLCIKCIERDDRGKRVLINNKVPNKFHTSVLHGRKHEPPPPWSRCEGSEWFKTMLSKNYMTRKKDIDTKAVNEFIQTLDGKIAEKVAKLVEKFPILSKTAAIKCLQEFKKTTEPTKLTEPAKNAEPKKQVNKVDIVLKPTVVVKDEQEEVYDVLEISLEPKTIHNTKYLYEPNKNKVYTTDFKYVGRYNTREDILSTEYPDSDTEPCF